MTYFKQKHQKYYVKVIIGASILHSYFPQYVISNLTIFGYFSNLLENFN